MPSPFVNQFLKPLTQTSPPSPIIPSSNIRFPSNSHEAGTKEELQGLLASLNQQLSPSLVQGIVTALTQIESQLGGAVLIADPEITLLKDVITTKLLIGLYAEAIDTYLSQATDAETEGEWWADIARSRWKVAFYLLQTTPSRLLDLTRVIIQALNVQNLPVRVSAFTPSSLRHLFPSTDPRRANTMNQALFPHLRHQTLLFTSSTILDSSFESKTKINSAAFSYLWMALNPLVSLTKMPIQLTRQECNFKRKELEKLRDERAEGLGYLTQMRSDLAEAIRKPSYMQPFVHVLTCILEGNTSEILNPTEEQTNHAVSLIDVLRLSTIVFSVQRTRHKYLLQSRQLLRPSQLTLNWPKLLLLPPLCVYGLRSVYASRASLVELAKDVKATAEGFIKGWLLDPLKEVLKTVRAGGEDGVIVQKEGIAADLASLERMTLSLAEDQLNYNAEQLASLSKQIRLGDLTPVLQIYEEDIRSPLKSAITGTLLRSVFIQVQKAKVDIDQTLAGIDKLLKSQELTFAFVGVAPAFGILYLLGGSVFSLWTGGRGIGKYGGKQRICGVWSAMRRTERLLIAQPKSHHHGEGEGGQNIHIGSIPPLTSGLLLLSVARLRTYAERHLPLRSRLREGFLEDVADLENPDLGRADKMKVIERMWRCWGATLGWSRIAVEDISGR